MGWNLVGSGVQKSNSKLNNNNTKTKSGWNLQGAGKYELKHGDKTIGLISYSAKKAIENNTLDSYTPKNAEEKKVLETYKSLYSPVISEADSKKLNTNLDTLQKEIKNLESVQKKANEYQNKIKTLTNRANTVKHRGTGLTTGSTYEQQIKETEAEYKQFLLDAGFQNIGELTKQLSEKKQYKNSAKYIQEGKALADNIRSDSKFEEYVAKGKALGDEKADGWFVPDTQRKNMVAYLRNNPEAMATFETAAKASGKSANKTITEGSAEYKLAKYGTGEQVENYYAYLGKGDTANAEKYLKSIEESLNIAMGSQIANKKDTTFEKLAFGVTAGTDQFEQGMMNLFKPLGDDEYIPSSPTQFASGLVRESLKDSGVKILGTSIGQGAYDLINTTSNMLPSIGASYLANAIVPGSGAVVGATLMGGSAAGNSYQEKLNSGWDKKQALTYATVVGASEAGLQYALGGIGSLGGKITGKSAQAIAKGIDNAALRFAATYGINALSEGFEESLQEVLNPFFENLALGYQKNKLSDIEWEQVAYSGMLGALSAGFLEGGTTAIDVFGENANANTIGKYIKKNDFRTKVIEIASSSPEGSATRDLYTKYEKKGINAENISDLQLGRLFVNAESDVQTTLSKKKIEPSEEASARATLDALNLMKPESSISIGDTFKDTKSGRVFTVVDRSGGKTIVELETAKGTTTKAFADSRIGSFIANEQIEKIESGPAEVVNNEDMTSVETTPIEQNSATEILNVSEDTTIETTPTEDESVTMVRKVISGEKLTSKKIESIINNQTSRDAFAQITGIKLTGSKSEQRATVRNWHNTNAKKSIGTVSSQTKQSSIKVGDVFVNKNTGDTYTVAERDAENTTLYIKNNKGVTTTIIPNVLADDSFNVGNTFTRVKDSNTTPTNEVTQSAEETATKGKIQSVVDAMNETLREGALEEIYERIPKGYEKSLDVFAEKLISAYNKVGSLGHIAEYFVDGGQKVIAAIEGKADTTTETASGELSNVETKSDLDNNLDNSLQNQPESDTMEEKTSSKTEVIAKSATTTTDKSNTSAYTNDNEKIDLKFKVVSVDDLIASNELDGRINPNYPQELQPRDRNRASSRSQINQIANDLNPERLAESTNVSEGAPIVGADNVVESGNGRTLAIKLAYITGAADGYRNFIIDNANEYGIDATNLPENPVLVRERLTEVDRVEFTRKANESSISSLSATEQAKVDAENLTQDVLNLLVANDDGVINTSDNKNFISTVLTKVFKSEDLNNVVNAEGRLSARGLERITNAIFYKAYGDASLSARLSESLDNDMKNATKVLLNIAPRVVSIKNDIKQDILYNFDFSEDIAGAVRLFEKCRNDKKTIEDYANQMSLFDKESPVVLEMAYVFETKNRGAKQATEFYNLLLDTVEGLGSPKQTSLGLNYIFQSKEEIFNATVERFNNGNEPKNTVTIPESIYRPESQEGRIYDRRGTDEVSGDNTSRSETSGDAVEIQRDNGPSEERGIAQDDEQLRQTNESTEGKQEVREDNSDEERRDDLLSDNSRRGNDGNTGKQARQIQSFERKNKGKNAIERRKFGRELIKRGQVEKVNDGKHEYTLVKPEAYNEDMQSMVDEAKKNGRELSFFIGTATVTKDDGSTFQAEGIRFGGANRIAVQYDGNKPPQKIAKHETIHSKWLTPKVQKIAKKILTSLSEADRQKIAEQNRYEYYQEIFEEEIANGKMDIVWEEFVCDVMSGISDYTVNYIDDVNAFWYSNEEAEGYDPASYATSTDAGGNKYSFSSLGFAFFGNEDITSEEFEKMVSEGSYKKQKGYRDYVKSLVNVYKQSRGIKGMLSGSEVRKIEKQIEGIMKVAIASKKAGYDIYDDGDARSIKDSKNRLLFSSLEPNSDYVTSSDIATICDKRKNFSEIYDDIVSLEEKRGVPANKRFFKNVDNYFILHKIMADKGLTIPCEECYVESMRKNLGSMAQAFIDLVQENDENNKSNEQLYHQKGKDKGKLKTNNATRRTMVRELLAENEIISADDLTVEMLTTAKGLTKLRLQAPLVYEQFNAFYGQAKPKLTREATPFRPGELIALLTKDDGTIDTALVKEIVATGGFRLQSYSDFQIKNFVDVIQTIFEAGMLGLNGHAYTKVPTFLEATEGTNLKRNISIFMYEDGGNWVLDKKNSFPMELEDIYALVAKDESGNTSIIAVSQNADMSAWIMANDNVGYGIPFHKSGLKMETVRSRTVKTPDGREVLGYANEIDHTKQQSEVYKKTVSAKEKANTKVKKPINIYQFWDFKNKDNLSQKKLIEKNVKRYIDECEKRNYRPKFRAYVMNNSKLLNKILEYSKELGYVPQNATIEDISFKHGEYTIPYGYYKFIGDFGMFKPDGSASSIETLSLENYDFDKAIDFFKDSSKLRQNELLQQLENGEVREGYRKMLNKGELTIEQLDDIIKQKRMEVVEDVVGNRYSIAEEESEQYGVMWTLDKGVLDNNEVSAFYEKISETKNNKYQNYHNASDGQIIYEIENKLIYTDGDYDYPHISQVVTIKTNDNYWLQYGRECFYDGEKYGYQTETVIEIVEAVLGEGAVETATYNSHETDKGSRNTGGKRKNVTETNRGSQKDVDVTRYSIAEESYAPTFYSHMSKTIDDMKQDKIGANSVVSYLKGRGVKDEEIKWSGIEEFLEGKKSVTKAELQEFVASNQLEIEETVLDGDKSTTLERQEEGSNDYYVMRGGEIYDTLTWDSSAHIWVSDAYGFYFDSMPRIRSYYGVDESGTRWGKYTLEGGGNYREITFKMPNSDYSNQAMRTHWGEDAKGILAHARVQDFDVDGEKMLFIEEIQSDWHNEGQKKGYADINKAKTLNEKSYELRKKNRVVRETLTQEIAEHLEGKVDNPLNAAKSLLINLGSDGTGSIREFLIKKYGIPYDLIGKIRAYDASMQEMAKLGLEASRLERGIENAPFRNNYHEYVLKRLIRMAAEDGYDSIGWTTADIQSKRWSDEYAEGYRIEYDQDIPKFLNKYGKKWGAKVGKTEIGKEDGGWYEVEGTEVWSMPITDSMKNSVLYEGQTRYSLADDGELDLEDLWSDAIEKYGTIKKGEMPAREIDVPKKISKKDVVSLGARTMMEAGITPDDAISEFEQRILDGTMTHEVITNKKAGAWAKQQIESLGFEEALNRWSVLSDSGKVGKKELALGMELYNQCITNKDVHNAMKIAAELVAEATNAGQTLQAVRMLKRMTPDGQLYYLEKSIKKMNEEFKEKLGKRFKDIELDEGLMEAFLTETDAKKRDEVYDKLCQNIADQIPSTFKDKWNAWRYLAMLGNPRTHIRNVVGNAIFIPSIRLKNYVGAIIEKASRVDIAERTKSLHKSKEAVEFAKQDITDKDVMRELKGVNAKYATTDDIESKRTIFDKWWQKWAEKLRTKNFEWLEKEDGWFLKAHYVDALARLITARKIDVTSIDEQTLEKLRSYAIKEAQVATYRDANAFADGLNAIQRKMERSDKKIIRASSVLIEGVMPFKKTPLNIAKQGIYYSPVGILKGIYTATAKLKKGDATVTDVIDDISKGLTGTAVMMLGCFLASIGLLVGDDDKNKKEKEFDKMTGEQSYAFKIGDFSYTIDWATPSNLALFVGAKLYDLTKDDFSFADVTSALSTVTEPLLELSVFSGVSGVIDSATYSDSNPVIAITSDMVTSYLMQALPTIGGQLSRIVDESKREYYYVDKTSDVPKGLQRLIGQASSKIPLASYLFEPAIDEWGREETYGNVAERAFENTISPGYYSAENYTSVDRKLRKLYEKTGDSAVLPVIQQKYYTEDYVKYDMTAEEYTKVKKLRGRKSFELVRSLLSDEIIFEKQEKRYSSMSDDEKVKAIKKCYEEAGKYAKEQMIEKIKR